MVGDCAIGNMVGDCHGLRRAAAATAAAALALARRILGFNAIRREADAYQRQWHAERRRTVALEDKIEDLERALEAVEIEADRTRWDLQDELAALRQYLENAESEFGKTLELACEEARMFENERDELEKLLTNARQDWPVCRRIHGCASQPLANLGATYSELSLLPSRVASGPSHSGRYTTRCSRFGPPWVQALSAATEHYYQDHCKSVDELLKKEFRGVATGLARMPENFVVLAWFPAEASYSGPVVRGSFREDRPAFCGRGGFSF